MKGFIGTIDEPIRAVYIKGRNLPIADPVPC